MATDTQSLFKAVGFQFNQLDIPKQGIQPHWHSFSWCGAVGM